MKIVMMPLDSSHPESRAKSSPSQQDIMFVCCVCVLMSFSCLFSYHILKTDLLLLALLVVFGGVLLALDKNYLVLARIPLCLTI